MNCVQCGTEMVIGWEDRAHGDLPGVVLRDLEVRRCPSCGEWEEVLPRIEDLHRLLAAAIVAKRARLTAEEIRFLRHTIGMEADLAKQLGVTTESLSRWENGTEAMGPVADRLLRVVAASELGIRAPRELGAIADVAEPLRVELRFGAEGWHVVDAKAPAEAWASAPPEERAAVLAALAPEHFDERRRGVAEAAIAVLKQAAA